MQASGCQQSQQGDSVDSGGAAAVPGPMNSGLFKPPDAPRRPPPISIWTGAYTCDAAPLIQGENSHIIQTEPTLLPFEFEQVNPPSDQQLTETAAAWRNPGVPTLAAMQSLPSAAKYLAPISCRYSWALPEPMAVLATAQQEDASHTSYSMPSKMQSSHTRPAVSLHPNQASNMLTLHHNDQHRYLVPSGNFTTLKHPLGVAACRPVYSAAELLTRLKICRTSDSGSTASEGGKYAQHSEGFSIECPDFHNACNTTA